MSANTSVDVGTGLDIVAPGSNASADTASLAVNVAPPGSPELSPPPASPLEEEFEHVAPDFVMSGGPASDSSDDVEVITDAAPEAVADAAPEAVTDAAPTSQFNIQAIIAYAAQLPGPPPGFWNAVQNAAAPTPLANLTPPGPQLVDDPMFISVGAMYIVTPVADLVLPGYFWPSGPKYYAVTRGHFVGVFNNPGTFCMATSGVSCPTAYCTRDLQVALDFFNTARRAGMLSIVP